MQPRIIQNDSPWSESNLTHMQKARLVIIGKANGPFAAHETLQRVMKPNQSLAYRRGIFIAIRTRGIEVSRSREARGIAVKLSEC
jgi:UPF0288 family protein (methanogenesis marker protein 3)